MKRTWTTPGGTYSRFYKELLNQPHVMIAGATGSGKSVVINALIYTALDRFPSGVERPDSAGFILIDPKRVELAKYKPLPHVLRYASEPSEMVQALEYAMTITEDRYRVMQRKGLDKWPFGDIYVIIDEFADLMTTNKKAVQPLIQRLAQIGRAAKVHIILATQCPLAKVIPTEIKVNFDSILGLRTATPRHSTNIIDETGCELLPDPKVEHRAEGYYRNGANLELLDLKMVPLEEIRARIRWWTDQNKGLFSWLFGKMVA